MRQGTDHADVVITTNNDQHYFEDVNNLSKLQIEVTHRFSSAVAALDYVKYNRTRLLITDVELNDMQVYDFLRQLRKQVKINNIPVVVISHDSSKEFVLEVIAAGCSGFVIRPYMLDTLRKHIQHVVEEEKFYEIEDELLDQAQAKLVSGDFDGAIADLGEIISGDKGSQKSEAEKYFEMGTRYLLEKKYGKAIIAFNRALKLNSLFIKAYTGLAEAYKGKGDMEKYKFYLQKAADHYAKLNEFDEVKGLFVKILQCDPNAPNPYNTLGINLRKKGKYHLACEAYHQALKLDPKDENIYYNLAKAYFFAKQTDKAIECLKQAIAINNDFEEAKKFFTELTNKKWDEFSV